MVKIKIKITAFSVIFQMDYKIRLINFNQICKTLSIKAIIILIIRISGIKITKTKIIRFKVKDISNLEIITIIISGTIKVVLDNKMDGIINSLVLEEIYNHQRTILGKARITNKIINGIRVRLGNQDHHLLLH